MPFIQKIKKNVFEVWYDFMPRKALRLYNYEIVHTRKCTKIEAESFIKQTKDFAEQENKLAFTRRFHVISYNDFLGFLRDEAQVLGGESNPEYKKIYKKTKPYFTKINPQTKLL